MIHMYKYKLFLFFIPVMAAEQWRRVFLRLNEPRGVRCVGSSRFEHNLQLGSFKNVSCIILKAS